MERKVQDPTKEHLSFAQRRLYGEEKNIKSEKGKLKQKFVRNQNNGLFVQTSEIGSNKTRRKEKEERKENENENEKNEINMLRNRK